MPITNNVVTVTTPGTPVRLSATSLYARDVDIVALPSNTGRIAYGSASIRAATGSLNGAWLNAGDAKFMEDEDLSLVYIDATVAGEGVTLTVLT